MRSWYLLVSIAGLLALLRLLVWDIRACRHSRGSCFSSWSWSCDCFMQSGYACMLDVYLLLCHDIVW